MALFAKFIGKLRTKNFEAHFHRKLRTLEKWSNVKKLRTAVPQPIFTGSYKKKLLRGTLLIIIAELKKAEFRVTDILCIYSKMEIYMFLSFLSFYK